MRPLLPSVVPVLACALACGGAFEPAPPASVPAPAVEAGPRTAWMVVLAGSAAHDEAEQRHAAALTDPRTPAVGAHPRLLLSDDVEGLKPGFWIVVGATVDDEATAAAIAKAMGARWEGAYTREVRVPAAEIESVRCPDDPRCTAAKPPGWRVLVVFDQTDGMTFEEWDVTPPRVIERAKNAGIDARWQDEDWIQDVVVDGRKVAEVDITPFVGELFGYVFAEEGREPTYRASAPTADVIAAAEAYFGVDIPE